MKTRIIVAVICVPLLFIVLFFLPPIATTVLVSVIAALASYELIKAVGGKPRKRLAVYAGCAAFIIPISTYMIGPGTLIFRAVLFLLPAVLFGDAVLNYKTENSLLSHAPDGCARGRCVYSIFPDRNRYPPDL